MILLRLLLFSESLCLPLFSQEIDAAKRYGITNGATGKEFWIAIPPNEHLPFPVDELEVYITSNVDTEVEIFDAAGNRRYVRNVTAHQVRTLSDKRGETNWTWEVREAERPVRKGIRIRSKDPITVSVLNSKVTTTDGFLALPVSAWDTSYIVTSYYDFREVNEWAGGFVIIAAENGTVVDITLRGVGENDAKTSGGKSINTGTTFQVSMDEGDVYYVQGDGKTRGVFDLTGTAINSNKPVGLISCHQRTFMPSLLVNGNGRNHLAEMNIPVSQWDTSYATIEFNREHINGQGMGDVFRVVASEPNTVWKSTSYDIITKEVINQIGGTISKAGGFADVALALAPMILPHGVTTWSANKPIQVVQYSCSSTWDGDPILDPFQINLLPTDRFIYGTTFPAPGTTKFFKHSANLIFLADSSDDSIIDKLKSVTFDGKPIWNHAQSLVPGLLFSHIPGTPYWFARIDFGTSGDGHTILSPHIPFSGYIYGSGEFDAYGMPLGPLHSNVVAMDTSDPKIDLTQFEIGAWDVHVKELVNIPDPIRPKPLKTDQVDAGVAEVGFMENSVNVTLIDMNDSSYIPRKVTDGVYRVVVQDKTKDARGRLYALDYAGNVSYFSISFTGVKPKLSTIARYDFDTVNAGEKVCADVSFQISNIGTDTLTISDMTPSLPFTRDRVQCDVPIKIAPADSIAATCVCISTPQVGEYTRILPIVSNDPQNVHNVELHAFVVKPTSVDEENEMHGVKVNMMNGGLEILVPSAFNDASVTISTLRGEIVIQRQVEPGETRLALSTAHLSKGVYAVHIQSPNLLVSKVILVTD